MPYCPKCGAEVSEEAEFCPKCGATLRAARVTRTYREKQEKGEKEEKHEKREKEEKGEKHEKGGGGRAGAVTGGLVLIWLGVTFYLSTLGIIRGMDWWAYFLLGLGIILIFQAVLMAASTGGKGLAYGPLIGGAILSIIGATGILGVRDWWPLILIALGLFVIITALRERMRSPRP